MWTPEDVVWSDDCSASSDSTGRFGSNECDPAYNWTEDDSPASSEDQWQQDTSRKSEMTSDSADWSSLTTFNPTSTAEDLSPVQGRENFSWSALSHLTETNRSTSEVCVTPASTPSIPPKCLADVLRLLQPSDSGGQPLPMRPNVIADEMLHGDACMFRELRSHKRGQGIDVGSKIDRWRNSGGKFHSVLLDIPKHMQVGDHNAVIMRQGNVLRANGSKRLRYRQWYLATSLLDGSTSWPSQDCATDTMLFHVCTTAQVKDQFCPHAKLKMGAEAEAKRKRKRKRKPVPLASSSSRRPPAASPSNCVVEEMDFGLLVEPDSKRLFPRHELRGASWLRRALLGSSVLAVLGVISVYVLGPNGGIAGADETGAMPPPADGITCPPNTFSTGTATSACQTCSVCPPGAITVSTCGDGQDTECMRWATPVELEPPVNSAKQWHLRQFSVLFHGVRDPFNRPLMFGGVGSPTSEDHERLASLPALPPQSPQAFCPIRGPEFSSELWRAPCDFWARGIRGQALPSCRAGDGWKLLGGNKTNVHQVGHTTAGELGWPSARSAAISLDIPSASSGQFMDRVVLSGAFPPPCLPPGQQPIGVEYLINPSDMWGLNSGLEWHLFGGEQTWVALSVEAFTATMVAGQLESFDFNSGKQKIPWPLGRHDSHSWIVGGTVLVFSGAMDLYRRDPSACARNESTCMVKNSYLLRDWWTRPLLSLRDKPGQVWPDRKMECWSRGDLSTSGVVVAQPGPRLYGATWTIQNRQALLFGGIGLLFAAGGAVHGSAVAAPTDAALQRLCDMWRYEDSQWQLVGSCSDNTAELARHGLAPSGTSPDVLARSTGLEHWSQQTHMLLREAVLTTTWVDSSQNLWLFGGARCADGSGGVDCEAGVAERLNHAASLPQSTVYQPAISTRSLQHAAIGAQPCSNDLWRFDTKKLTWSVHTYAEYARNPSTAATARSWPEAECGAVALVSSRLNIEKPETPGQFSSSGATLVFGGWRDHLFSPCQDSTRNDSHSNGASTPAVCSNNIWSVEDLPQGGDQRSLVASGK